MFTPELPLKLRFDKCQGCGPWTSGEQAVATYKVMGAMKQREGNQATSGCNCTGKR